MTEFARRSSRVLVLDAADRLLLVRSLVVPGDPDSGEHWFTPGGGVEPGEDIAEAAARELAEETGIAVAPADLTWVAFTQGHADLSWVSGILRDDFFLHRALTRQVTVDSAGLTEFEQTHYRGHRWWTPGDLAASDEAIYPLGLAGLLADLVAGKIPAEPLSLPWNH